MDDFADATYRDRGSRALSWPFGRSAAAGKTGRRTGGLRRWNGRKGFQAAGGQILQSTESLAKLDGSETAHPVKGTQKGFGASFPFLRVAFETTRDQVSIGVATQTGARNYVVQRLLLLWQVTEAVEASASFAPVDGGT